MTNVKLPGGAGSATPEKDNAPWQARVEGEQGGWDGRDCADSSQQCKRWRGIKLHELKTGTLLAANAGLVVHFSDFESAKAWARGVSQ